MKHYLLIHKIKILACWLSSHPQDKDVNLATRSATLSRDPGAFQRCRRVQKGSPLPTSVPRWVQGGPGWAGILVMTKALLRPRKKKEAVLFPPRPRASLCIFIESRLPSSRGGAQRNLSSPSTPTPKGLRSVVPHTSAGPAPVVAICIREALTWTQIASRFGPGGVFVTWSSETHNDSRPASQVGGYKC